MEVTEALKEALQMQYSMEFIGFGTLPIDVSVDASVARQFVYKKGVGKMKHLELRHLWLQDLRERGIYSVRKVPRLENEADVLTHSPSAAELLLHRSKLGLYPLCCAGDVVHYCS